MKVKLLYARYDLEGNKETGVICNVDSYIEIENIGFKKSVTLLTPTDEGDIVTWKSVKEAQYLCSLEGNKECWHCRFSLNLHPPTFARPYSLRFDFDENSYWDTNGGQYYWASSPSSIVTLAKGEVSLVNAHLEGGVFSGEIAVLNLDFQKIVKLIYTADGWETRQEMDARYVSHHEKGQSSPDLEVDIFRFSGEVPESPTDLEFFVEYQVAGKVYRDTFFGRNYTLSYFL